MKQEAIYAYIDQAADAKKEASLAKIEAEKVDKKLLSYMNAQHVLDHIVEKPAEQSPTSTNYKACPSPPLFENHNFDVVRKEDPPSENVSASSNLAAPGSDRRPISG